MEVSAPIEIIYQDSDIIAVNKPPGISVTADRWDSSAIPLDICIRQHIQTDNLPLYRVHRLDKDTSGVIVYARNKTAHHKLSMDFQERRVQKNYHVFVHGGSPQKLFDINAPLLPNADSAHRTCVHSKGKTALTRLKQVQQWQTRSGIITFWEALPHTGRTHQIRAHLSYVNMPLLCDALYGKGYDLFLSQIKCKQYWHTNNEKPLLTRTALHAASLSLYHPQSGEHLTLTAGYPKDLTILKKMLNKHAATQYHSCDTGK